MNFKRINLVLFVVLAFAFTTYGYTDGYIMPDDPYVPEPVDVVAYTYTDSYWDVTPNSQDTSYITDEDGNTLPGYGSATLNFYGSITSDYNPWAQSQCIWNQHMMLLDLTIDQLIQMSEFTGWGTTMFGRWDFAGGMDMAIQFSGVVGVDNCGPTMPQMPIGGIGGIIIDGISGTSHSRYLNIFEPGIRPITFRYRHNTSHPREQCPARCALKIPQEVRYIPTIPGRFPGPELDLQLPFDKNGICADINWQPEIITRNECYNTYDLPF